MSQVTQNSNIYDGESQEGFHSLSAPLGGIFPTEPLPLLWPLPSFQAIQTRWACQGISTVSYSPPCSPSVCTHALPIGSGGHHG